MGRGTPNGPALRNGAVHSRKGRSTEQESYVWFWIISPAGGLLFGAIHLVAWNFVFPTGAEQWLWRASALTLLAVPLLYAFVGLATLFRREDREKFWIDAAYATYLFTLPFYAVVRAFLLVESFRSLYYLPPATYQATWTKEAPHLG